MNKLIFVTILWAFSFSLIGEFLAGKVDSYLAVFVRVTLASLVFLPFTKFRVVVAKIHEPYLHRSYAHYAKG